MGIRAGRDRGAGELLLFLSLLRLCQLRPVCGSCLHPRASQNAVQEARGPRRQPQVRRVPFGARGFSWVPEPLPPVPIAQSRACAAQGLLYVGLL